jgi:hypothetical protein
LSAVKFNVDFDFGKVIDFFKELPEKAYGKSLEQLAGMQEWFSSFDIGSVALAICFYGGCFALLYLLYFLLKRFVFKPLAKPAAKLGNFLKNKFGGIKRRERKLKPYEDKKKYNAAQQRTLSYMEEKFHISKLEKDRTIGREIKNIKKTVNTKGQVEVDALSAMYLMRNVARGSMVDENGKIIMRPPTPSRFFGDDKEFVIDMPNANEGKENLVHNEDGTIEYDVFGKTAEGAKVTFHYRIAKGGSILEKNTTIEATATPKERANNRDNADTTLRSEAAYAIAKETQTENERLRREIEKLKRSQTKAELKEAVDNIGYGGTQEPPSEVKTEEAMDVSESGDPEEPPKQPAVDLSLIGAKMKLNKSGAQNKKEKKPTKQAKKEKSEDNDEEKVREVGEGEAIGDNSEEKEKAPVAETSADDGSAISRVAAIIKARGDNPPPVETAAFSPIEEEQPAPIDYVEELKAADEERFAEAIERLTKVAPRFNDPHPFIALDTGSGYNFYIELNFYYVLLVMTLPAEHRKGFARWLCGDGDLIDPQRRWETLNAANDAFLRVTKRLDPNSPTPLILVKGKHFYRAYQWKTEEGACAGYYAQLLPGGGELPSQINDDINRASIDAFDETPNDKIKPATPPLREIIEKIKKKGGATFEDTQITGLD